MSDPKFALRRLVERVLKEGAELPLSLLLEQLVPVGKLRKLARKFDLSPKGFRIDKAPSRVLAAQLAELREGEKLDEVLGLLKPPRPRKVEPAADPGRVTDLESLVHLRDGEVARLKGELERSRENANRARERETELQHELDDVATELARQRRSSADLAKAAAVPVADRSQLERELERRLRECEDVREQFVEADESLRRQLALERSRMRELEAEVAELEGLIPKSRRRKKKPLPPLPEQERRVLVPYFLPSFYKSLVGKDRKAIERAVQAVLLFCTEGHGYPGLEVKQIRGQDTWSMRASLGLRVYFRHISDGDVEVIELGDREDQNTTLRRLKEK